MRNKQHHFKISWLLGVLAFITTTGCERELSDQVEFATFPSTAEVFTDAPVGLGSNFYFPFANSKATAWSVDDEESYEGTASMRFDVPNANDPDGNYAGAIFRIDGENSGRNLTEFDALTFWGKASQAVTIAEVGFGEDFEENKYVATVKNLSFTTSWKKYIIPIPDPKKLIKERGVLRYSAAGIGNLGSEVGYTFWMDEVKFEKLGTIAQSRPSISGATITSIEGATIDLVARGLFNTFNLADGSNQTVTVAPAYFSFSSSDPSVARVSENGIITIADSGRAVITASIAGVKAIDSLVITSSSLEPPNTPTTPAANVKSILGDTYTPVTEINYDPRYGGSTTVVSQIGSFLSYQNNNYTGIEFSSLVDASEMTHLHVDIYTKVSGTSVGLQIRDFGANGVVNTDTNTGNPIEDDKDKRYTASGLTVEGWTSVDIPLDGDITNQKNNLGSIILTGGPDFIFANIYFYKQ